MQRRLYIDDAHTNWTYSALRYFFSNCLLEYYFDMPAVAQLDTQSVDQLLTDSAFWI